MKKNGSKFFQQFHILIIWLSPFLVYSQTPGEQNLVNKMMPTPVPASPNVASLGKFGDYEVSHFTGLPNISIPIYEVKSGGLTIPIVLSYHASGIKPTDVASWVGAGWSLSTGGQISRSLNGWADEAVGNGYSGAPLHPDPNTCSSYSYLSNAAKGIIDTQPDIFSYSFGNHSGKFMMTQVNAPYLFPYAPIKIVPSAGLNTFEITDEKGIVHRFGQNSSFENSYTQSGPDLTTGARSAWHLTQIVAPNSSDQISIDYQDIGSFSMHDVSYAFTVSDACSAWGGESCPPEAPAHTQTTHVTSSGDQKGPSTITFATGKVKFIPSAAFREDVNIKYLDRIEIQTLGGVIMKTIKFNYSYFTSPNGGKAALKLDLVQLIDGSGAIVQNYKLDYHTNSVSWKRSNPQNYSDLNARDLWGYYNGATANTNLLLPQTISYLPNVGSPTTISFGGAFNRSVNAAYVKEGVLRRITFPTGGFTEFDFESNKYLNGSTPTLVGGLRVTKITSSDGSGNPPIVKTYKYGQNETGYGHPNFWQSQFNYNSSQFYLDRQCELTEPTVQYQIRSYQSNVSFSYESYPVMYTHVTEYIGDFGGTTNGKIIYVYDGGLPINDSNYITIASGKSFRNNLSWKRGKLTSRTVYNTNNNKLQESIINYSLHKGESRHVGFGVHQYYPVDRIYCAEWKYPSGPGATCQTEGIFVYVNGYYWTFYYQDTGASLETSRTERLFQATDVNKFLETTTTHAYHADKLQPLQSSLVQSGETTWTINKYPFEFNANASSTGVAEGIYMLNQKNILTAPIETYSYKVNSGGDQVVGGQLTTFRKNSSNTTQVVPDQIYVWESPAPLPKSTHANTMINGSNNGLTMDTRYKSRIIMQTYAASGNIQSVLKTDDLPITYLWGYADAYPVAQVTNVSVLNDVASTSFESENKGNWTYTPSNVTTDYLTGVISHNIANSLQKTSLTTAKKYKLSYCYKGGTVNISTTPVAGSVVTYTNPGNNWIYWEGIVTGVSSLTVSKGTGTTVLIDEVRLHPTDAQMTTYTYHPVFGITSVTDANNSTSYYEYDAFGRLRLVRDKERNIQARNEYQYKIN